jgi:RNase adapter protein RapZ
VTGDQPRVPADPAAATIVITGLAGAGKSTALKLFEDQGYYCVENLPAFLLTQLVEGMAPRMSAARIAVVIDARDSAFAGNHARIFNRWRELSTPFTVLFLEASEETLLRRYSQERRVHPLTAGKSLREGIRLEREQLAGLRESADLVLDTTDCTPHELRRQLLARFASRQAERAMQISFLSFGFKYGSPAEADLVLDVRFLPNPFFIPALSAKSGLEAEVASYVLENELARQFFSLISPLLTFLIPQYHREGKAYLTIGIGCTGGRHRSVAVAEELAGPVKRTWESVRISHRDLGRG